VNLAFLSEAFARLHSRSTASVKSARLRGGTLALAPVLDLLRDPRWGRAEEYFGEDPFHVGQMGIAAVRGLQGQRPLADDRLFVTLKHFIHGSPQGGINIAPADISERTLREIYLVPFEMVLGATDAAAVMPAYNEVGGVPAHASFELLQKTGRERLGFQGPYFSDYRGITNLMARHKVVADLDEAALMALRAGIDAELPDAVAYARLPALVREGHVKEATLDTAVARILTLKFEAGLFERPYSDAARARKGTQTVADVALARRAAQRSLVLLKNDGVLPLDPNARMKLAIIGPNAKPPLFGAYSGHNPKALSVLDGLRAATAGSAVRIEHADGVWITPPYDGDPSHAPLKLVPPANNARRIAEAVELAKRSDLVVLVVGDNPTITREALTITRPNGAVVLPGDRRSIGLYGYQDALVDALLAAGKPVVALLLNGRPLATPRLADGASALLEGWYLGQEGGPAVADVLFGRVNPGGKLPVSIPRSAADLPIFYNRHLSADVNAAIEGPRQPLFPFGHGLSYTRFTLSAPRLSRTQIAVGDSVDVEVDVTNIGLRAGDEVVQLDVRDDISSVPRPVLELQGFQRVSLAPGVRRTLRFTLTPRELAFWNLDMQRVVEPGSFTISTGNSSSLLQSVSLSIRKP
jgi:beta-glucosidase